MEKKESILKYLPIIIFLMFLMPILGKIGPFIIIIVLVIVFKKYSHRFDLNKLNFKNKKKTMDNTTNTIDMDKISVVKNPKKAIWTIIIAVLIIWLFFASIVIVDAGETGVYSLFGKVKDQELRSGFHLVIPLAKVDILTIRTEEYTMSGISTEGKKAGDDAIIALTKEGLNVDLDMTVLYRLDEEKAAELYKTVGLNYEEKIIRPAIRSTIREVIAQYEAKDIYSEKREEAAQKIMDNLKEDTESRGIIIETVLLRNVKLPENLATSIQEKLQAEQEAQKYEFILQKEIKEKERKIIEAEGQRDAQSIINQSLTTNYLYYLYVSQLKDREGTIYVPTSNSTGMPLFKEIGN
ncbi:MAG: prohibitin family protein [bacterium]